MSTIERAPVSTLAVIPLTTSIDMTHALVTVDAPQLPAVATPALSKRLNRAAAIDQALFKSSALKGEVAKNTVTGRMQRNAGTIIAWTSGVSALALGVLGTMLSPHDPSGLIMGVMLGGGGMLGLGNGASFLSKKVLGAFVTPQALRIETLRDITTEYANADDVGRAMISAQARSWIGYLDGRHVTGEFARRQLQSIVDARATLPAESLIAGESLNTLARSLRDEQGAPLSELRSEHAFAIRSAIIEMPEAYRTDAAAYVMDKLFRNEACRLNVPNEYGDRHREACRQLLATLVANLPMPELFKSTIYGGPR